MASHSNPVPPKLLPVLVAGDVCLDVVGVPILEKSALSISAAKPGSEALVQATAESPKAEPTVGPDNWRQTSENRTHFLPGGAMLLAEFIRAPRLNSANRNQIEDEVAGPRPMRPPGISEGEQGPLGNDQFLAIAERVRRSEVVHSLIELAQFPTTTKKDDKGKTLRVVKTHGFSGPDQGDPKIQFQYPVINDIEPQIIVLDDTGNSFRRTNPLNPWPAQLSKPADAHRPLMIVYKLHRPILDGEKHNLLWKAVSTNHPWNRLVVVTVDDLRDMGIRLSEGLSWERTALDLVWHLLNGSALQALRDCPRLIVRLGESGALYWQRQADHAPNSPTYQAWLIYDPPEIEGSFLARYEQRGGMVGLGSAFTAGLVHELAKSEADLASLRQSPTGNEVEPVVLRGIRAGLLASRRLLQLGFGNELPRPRYPGKELFEPPSEGDAVFACRTVPIITDSLQPDRGYWRLLDDIFAEASTELRLAVELIATGRKMEPLRKNELPEDPKTADYRKAAELLAQAPMAVFADALRTYDRREIENYRALYALIRGYIRLREPERPLSVAVFGPPGAGKSFGVKQVAKALTEHNSRPIVDLTFNLSQYQTAEELAAVFHLVRDLVLQGKIPLVFFDEFDTSLNGRRLAWLRYFLAPMQDGQFLDRGAPHPIGQAIFVFAGGTCDTYHQFAAHSSISDTLFKAAKGPDFLSRLRGALDVPSLDFIVPRESCARGEALPAESRTGLLATGTYDPYGPTEFFPSQAAVLLRRAGVLAHQLATKARGLKNAKGTLQVREEVLRTFLYLPKFEHGNRSLEALLDMSRLSDANAFTASLFPAAVHSCLHAVPAHIDQLVATVYPFPPEDLDAIAEQIHRTYLAEREQAGALEKDKASHYPWATLDNFYKNRNREAARAIPDKLRSVGLWFRKLSGPVSAQFAGAEHELEPFVEWLAQNEHDRWVADQRRQGYIYGPQKDRLLRHHPSILPWAKLSREVQDQDRDTIRNIPKILAACSYEIVKF